MADEKKPLNWQDISDEKFRIYTFPGDDKLKVAPKQIAITESGSHRLETLDGRNFNIAPRWNYFEIGVPFRF